MKENKDRYLVLAAGLAEMSGNAGPVRVFTAAGRTELCGNHTDHNLGKVIAAAVQFDMLGFVCPRNDKILIFRSTGFPDAVVDLSDLAPHKDEQGKTEAILRGIAAEFIARGASLQGFNVCADSSVPVGSGLSSSAAMEVFFAKAFDCLNFEGKTTPLELAQLAQNAENRYFGKPCGLMDQAASAIGGAVYMDFGTSPIVSEAFAFNPDESGYALCVVNTGGSHDSLTEYYAAIPAEMKAVAAFFGKTCLRELTKAEVLASAVVLRKNCGDRALLRALHFFDENARVEKMRECMRNRNIEEILDIINESGASSWQLLQNIDTGQNPRSQNLALALAMTRDFVGKSGACRVHGGGFAGTIQAYVPKQDFLPYLEYMEKVFGSGSVCQLFIREVGTAELEEEKK